MCAKKKKVVKDEFTRGYFCAASVCFRQHRMNSVVEDLVNENYFSIKDLRKAGVDDYDIEILMPIFKEIERKRKLKS